MAILDYQVLCLHILSFPTLIKYKSQLYEVNTKDNYLLKVERKLLFVVCQCWCTVKQKGFVNWRCLQFCLLQMSTVLFASKSWITLDGSLGWAYSILQCSRFSWSTFVNLKLAAFNIYLNCWQVYFCETLVSVGWWALSSFINILELDFV